MPFYQPLHSIAEMQMLCGADAARDRKAMFRPSGRMTTRKGARTSMRKISSGGEKKLKRLKKE